MCPADQLGEIRRIHLDGTGQKLVCDLCHRPVEELRESEVRISDSKLGWIGKKIKYCPICEKELARQIKEHIERNEYRKEDRTAEKKKEPCEYCGIKPYFCGDGIYDEYGSRKKVTDGRWASTYIGAEADGKIFMMGTGDEETEHYYPKFCPECGRRLTDPPREGETAT